MRGIVQRQTCDCRGLFLGGFREYLPIWSKGYSHE